jgi:hypothetical protein
LLQNSNLIANAALLNFQLSVYFFNRIKEMSGTKRFYFENGSNIFSNGKIDLALKKPVLRP